MKYLIISLLLIFFCISTNSKADEVSNWLTKEIDIILNAYIDTNLTEIEKFEFIESAINENFAGSGIAKFVAGKAWAAAEKDTKKTYITLFKRHLALTIASMMKSYSNQTYELIKTKFDEKNKVYLVDMEIRNDTNALLVTWRVKESKNQFFVIDLLVANISLVVTKRSEFNSMLKKVNNDLKSFNKVLSSKNEQSFQKLTSN